MSGDNQSRTKRTLVLLLSVSIVILWSTSQKIPVRSPSTRQDVRGRSLQGNAIAPQERIETSLLHDDESFSACLLTKDDSHFLIEWIAYHYHTLPLRRLIVAVDPESKTSPTGIFDRWRKYGMTIDEWTDTHFLENTKKIESRKGHQRLVLRQTTFYRNCLRTLKDENRTWTMLTDTDEYLSYNSHTPGNWAAVDIEQPGSFLKYLKQERAKNETQLQDSPCILMPRLRYGSAESRVDQVERQVPNGFNGSAFQTLRFRKYGNPSLKKTYGACKSLVDVSQIETEYIQKGSPHRPLRKYCPKELVFIKPKMSPLIVRHYLGTWEQFFFRDDARQSEGINTNETYNKFKDIDFGEDDAIRPWIKGFVEEVGYDAARELLDGVGNVSVAPPMMHAVS